MNISRLFPILSAIGIASASAAYSQGADSLGNFEYHGYLQVQSLWHGGPAGLSFAGQVDLSGPLGGNVGLSLFAYGFGETGGGNGFILPSLYFDLGNNSRLHVGMPRSAMAIYKPDFPLMRLSLIGADLTALNEGTVGIAQMAGAYSGGLRYDTMVGATDVSASLHYIPDVSGVLAEVAARHDMGNLAWSGGLSYLAQSGADAVQGFVAVEGESGAFSYGAELQYNQIVFHGFIFQAKGHYAVNDRLSIGLSGFAFLDGSPSYIIGADATYKIGSYGFIRADLANHSTSGVRAAVSVGLDF